MPQEVGDQHIDRDRPITNSPPTIGQELGDQAIVLSVRSIAAVGAQIMVNPVQGDDRLTGGFVLAIAGH